MEELIRNTHPGMFAFAMFATIVILSLLVVLWDRFMNPLDYVDDDKYIYSGNEFYSNVSLTELLVACNRVEFVKRYSVVSITYSDGFIKDFNALEWEQLGKHILANCKRIKVHAHLV